MSVPKFRNASSRVRRRRAHHALKAQSLGVCTNCKAPVKPHNACAACGQYKGRSVGEAVKDVKPAAPAKIEKTAKDSGEAKESNKKEKAA